MKKYYKITAFVMVIVISAVTLTAGISKEGSRSGGGYKDLVDELYDQAVKQNDNLEAIEDGIEKFYKNRNEAIEKYNNFTFYNNRYYTDAKSKAATITDAATKQRASDLINKSEAAYKTKITGWQNTIATLNTSEKEMTDLHTLLKIMVTEPMIGKYQTSTLPDDGKLKETITELQKVLEKIKVVIE